MRGISGIRCTIARNYCAGSNAGIQAGGYCLVIENMVTGTTAGILVSSINNRIEGNNVNCSGIGIDVDFDENLIIRNSVSSRGTTAYDIVAGNTYGEILDFSSGGEITSGNPWANFEY